MSNSFVEYQLTHKVNRPYTWSVQLEIHIPSRGCYWYTFDLRFVSLGLFEYQSIDIAPSPSPLLLLLLPLEPPPRPPPNLLPFFPADLVAIEKSKEKKPTGRNKEERRRRRHDVEDSLNIKSPLFRFSLFIAPPERLLLHKSINCDFWTQHRSTTGRYLTILQRRSIDWGDVYGHSALVLIWFQLDIGHV